MRMIMRSNLSVGETAKAIWVMYVRMDHGGRKSGRKAKEAWDVCAWSTRKAKEFQRRGICPVEIFDDTAHRLCLCLLQEQRQQGFERLLFLPLWRQLERRIVVGEGGDNSDAKACGLFAHKIVRRQCGCKFAQLSL